MNIHEYQGKQILKQYGVSVPSGMVAFTPTEAVEAARKIKAETEADTWAVKAQIHAGGRGKGGGVKIAKSFEEVEKYAKDILGMTLRDAAGIMGISRQGVSVSRERFLTDLDGNRCVYESLLADIKLLLQQRS